MSDVAIIFIVIATFIWGVTALTAFASVIINGRRIKDVKEEVKTANSQTLAQLVDASESRRIENIAVKNRTPLEKHHITETKQEK